MKSIGGVVSFLKMFTFVTLIYWMRKQWYESLYNEIRKEHPGSSDMKIAYNLRQRVSFKGIYKLHDLVSFFDMQLEEQEVTRQMNQEEMLQKIE